MSSIGDEDAAHALGGVDREADAVGVLLRLRHAGVEDLADLDGAGARVMLRILGWAIDRIW